MNINIIASCSLDWATSRQATVTYLRGGICVGESAKSISGRKRHRHACQVEQLHVSDVAAGSTVVDRVSDLSDDDHINGVWDVEFFFALLEELVAALYK